MKFDNALQLQAEILKEVLGYAPVADVAAAETFAAADAMQPVAGPAVMLMRGKGSGRPETRKIALGIARDTKKGFDLAVFVQQKKLVESSLVDAIVAKAPKETKVIYTGPVSAHTLLPWHRKRMDPLRIGSSIGHTAVTAGTLGCFVKDGKGTVGVLSNNHVLADVNRASIHDPIVQPGTADGGTAPADVVATLTNFITINTTGAPNFVDCAWATRNEKRSEERKRLYDSLDFVVGSLKAKPRPQSQVEPELPVLKIGRTTGYTQGQVQAINVNNLIVGLGGGLSARFDGQIAVESLNRNSFSQGGDSGSIICDTNFSPVALLFAGSKSGGFDDAGLTFANPIDVVLNKLSLSIAI